MTDSRTSRMTGLGRVLVFFYGLLALAATGRSVTQILTKFDEAPVAYALSALAAVVYIVATVALVAPARTRRPRAAGTASRSPRSRSSSWACSSSAR
ncbi:hypothetical protein BC477_01525 [Clavibacter michiganensis subsp. michiganensis]|uniref:Integral membrane protein n=1 Tax=Clavibacter michiganensis subsp. michiganensis TaxID=33013 RepID=A0A251XIX0_CLAMM|nr:hypothetical protein BC477_01525 [Clavibacter michiganensis subsp. michiganensis]OUE03387.1 hypothetical protein CMMCAS07_00460 [Clavibacter michiganensis subsp. michiganensis]